ncbi:MAG TPA: hypothetical protein VJI66_01270 [Candidatus Paceibacterota bacterium]
MIELTTGIVFLLSSMYGAGTISEATVDVQSFTNSEDSVASIAKEINKKELENYLEKHFADTPILIEIARCESQLTHFREDGRVLKGNVDSADTGVMQINARYHLENAKKLELDIYTVEGNVAYAKYLYGKYGTKPWKASSPCWGSKVIAKK